MLFRAVQNARLVHSARGEAADIAEQLLSLCTRRNGLVVVMGTRAIAQGREKAAPMTDESKPMVHDSERPLS